ncbi:hypothetical protein HK405_005672, partial [Cladochytrium tenue]
MGSFQKMSEFDEVPTDHVMDVERSARVEQAEDPEVSPATASATAGEDGEEEEIVVRAGANAERDEDAPGYFSWNPLDWYRDLKKEFDDFSWTLTERKRVVGAQIVPFGLPMPLPEFSRPFNSRSPGPTQLFRAVFGEGLCTFLFLFIVEATAVNNGRQENPENLVLGAIATGFCSIALIYSFADVSGAHFNPAVTFATIVTGKVSLRKGLAFIAIQLLAAILATAALLVVFPKPHDGTYKNIPSAVVVDIDSSALVVNAFFMELILTFILVYVIFATAFDTVDSSNTLKVTGRGPRDTQAGKNLTIYTTSGTTKAGFAPIAIGFTLGFLGLIGGSVSGGAFNPARAFGPAVLSGNFSHHWIGDFIGAALAGWAQGFFAHEAVQNSHGGAAKS